MAASATLQVSLYLQVVDEFAALDNTNRRKGSEDGGIGCLAVLRLEAQEKQSSTSSGIAGSTPIVIVVGICIVAACHEGLPRRSITSDDRARSLIFYHYKGYLTCHCALSVWPIDSLRHRYYYGRCTYQCLATSY